ncbi:MAG: hypothetical protein H6556_17620 [Lewinellaceae bacterium]|nr:hypothetical protein [Lewinellaceae bacterium]
MEEVRFYNASAYPPTYFHHDRISFITASIDTTAETPDTLHRVDMTFKNGKNDARGYGIQAGGILITTTTWYLHPGR